MLQTGKPIRVLYSFPHKIGAARICYTAWQQVYGLSEAGADVTVFPGVVHKALPEGVKVKPTLARGRFRIPYKVLGRMGAMGLHDYVVSRRLEKLKDKIDIIHTWPAAALQTIKEADRLGIPTVLERPNAHTRFAYDVVQEECKRMGIVLPPGHEYEYNMDVLRKEEEEFASTYRLLCPSDFVVKTFRDKGTAPERMVRHIYGFDETSFYPPNGERDPKRGLTVIFVGVCAVRKGVHFALDAWLKSPACKDGKFMIAGDFLPEYRDKLAQQLSHPSVQVLGHRNDIADLMRQSDVVILPSIEEGFGLVIAEGMGCGCIPMVSEACTDICKHMDTGLIHRVGDVDAIRQQFTMLHEDRATLDRLRRAVLAKRLEFTWKAAGVKLLDVYREVIESHCASSVQHVGV